MKHLAPLMLCTARTPNPALADRRSLRWGMAGALHSPLACRGKIWMLQRLPYLFPAYGIAQCFPTSAIATVDDISCLFLFHEEMTPVQGASSHSRPAKPIRAEALAFLCNEAHSPCSYLLITEILNYGDGRKKSLRGARSWGCRG